MSNKTEGRTHPSPAAIKRGKLRRRRAARLLGLAATGCLEYLIQRHGNWYLLCYSLMSLSAALMALSGYWMYRTLRGHRT